MRGKEGFSPLAAWASGFFGLFTVFLVLGIFFGNPVFLFLSLVPALYFFTGLSLEGPGEVSVEREGLEGKVWKDLEVEVSVKVSVEKGFGEVRVMDELPEPFQLIKGNNYRVFWKGFGVEEKRFSYTVKCGKRGSYVLPETKVECRDVLGVRNPVSFSEGGKEEVNVVPRTGRIKGLRGQIHRAFQPLPKRDVAKIGVDTTDFQEIREYRSGDQFRDINWKATAKHLETSGKPLVNEYESEGKKVVWLFLDASQDLEVGTNIDNVFEYAVEATEMVSRLYIEQKYRVGLYIFNNNAVKVLPETGEKHFKKIREKLVNLNPSSNLEGLEKGVKNCRKQLMRYKPFSLIFTSIYPGKEKQLKEGLKNLKIYTGGKKSRTAPVTVVNIKRANLHPTPLAAGKKQAAFLKEMETLPFKKELKKTGASLVDWDPVQHSLPNLLIKKGLG